MWPCLRPSLCRALGRRFSTAATPDEVVTELDKHIVGQTEAKVAVAIALRDRWRRQQLTPELQAEVMPNNILMVGPTGVGKTEVWHSEWPYAYAMLPSQTI